MWSDCCKHESTKWIKTAFFLNAWFAIIEFVWGILTNSVSIMSDALHDLWDSIALWISWYLEKRSNEWPTTDYSYGKRRLSLLSSVVNGTILLLWSFFIIKEAIERLLQPEQVNAQWMLLLAILGIAVNGFAVYRLQWWKWLNAKSVRLHLLEDVIGWIAVLIVSIVLMFYNIPQLDTLLWVGIALYVIFHAFKILKSALHLFLQKVPLWVDPQIIKNDLYSIKGVEEVHHMHIRSLDGDSNVFTAHIRTTLCNTENTIKIKQKILKKLERYAFEHTTIEIEFSQEDCSQTKT